MFKILLKIIKSPKYSIIGILGALIVFVVASLLPNYLLVYKTLNEGLLFSSKLIWNLLLSSPQTLGHRGFWYIVTISILSGLLVMVQLFYFKQRISRSKTPLSGFLGILAGIFGAGCASCGTIFLAGLAGAFGLGSSLYFLPFGGEELAWLGIILIFFSLIFSLKKASDPAVCLPE